MGNAGQDDAGMAPIDVDGCKYWLSGHAAERALDMNIPLQLIPHIIRGGTRYEAPLNSRYVGQYVVRQGKVSLAMAPERGGDVIKSILWATTDAWREACEATGREYRGDDRTRSALAKWFGEEPPVATAP